MHILLIHQAYASLNEPGGTRHEEMARYLVARGHRVTVIASPVNYLSGKPNPSERRWVSRREIEPGLTILRCYTYPAFHRSFFHRTLAFMSFMISSFWVGLGVPDVNVVWGTSPPIFQAATAWLLAFFKRVPFIFEVRDLWPEFAVAVGVLRNPVLIKASEGLERFLYRRAKRVVVNSPGFISHVQTRGAKWVELVPNGADPQMFDPTLSGESFRRRYGLDQSFVVLYAGAHGLSNDLGVVLDAADFLRDHPQIRFVFVGDGKEKSALMRETEAKGLKNVLFLPPFSKREMPEVLAAADVCVAILKPLEVYKTTYPNKVFDYMAAGRAVVLAIDGVVRQVVEEAGAGIAVPPGDAQALAKAILYLAENRELTKRMGMAGRHCIEENFRRDQMAWRMMKIFEEVAKDG
ncbi:glycosyltransferase family 4 protein [Thermanaerothrix sp. 4228-RoL]|uniref:Glycosyltransferase family 4 protein n=1 Tax=Thermanaerothrix solaris TaxID=3058434 RepID=A0ABU3NJ47_9CHLR|nr:glycosyltransferase family 4 protein [Thermanaerothrix sp. 4228-RoL]MDT8896881.1 glycosyltransferase family 4 protein [Thermanaerothrix sp. 4228-RoL]